MLLAEPLFVCVVGAAAAVLVVVTAPLWTAAASRLNQWFLSLLARASHTVSNSLDDQTEKVDKEDRE